jgi:hypothetical protein
MMRDIRNVANRLQLTKTHEDQILNRVNHYLGGKWKRGHGALLIVAACAYITCRLNNKPITLLDVADCINESSSVLGRTYSRIVQELKITLPDTDPSLFLERAISQLEIPTELTKEITQRSLRLISVAKDDSWITTGRRPASIAAAAIMLAMIASAVEPNLESIAKLLNVAQATIKTRARELRNTLAKIAIEELPWGSAINEKNIVNHLPAILKYIEFKARSTPAVEVVEEEKKISPTSAKIALANLPPSFAKNSIAKEERRKKIAIAKEKLSKMVSGQIKIKKEKTDEQDVQVPKKAKRKAKNQANVQFDEGMFIIERLLLRGVDETKILENDLQELARSELKEEISSEDVELNDKDLSEAEIRDFIRTPEEVAFLQELEAMKEPVKKRLKETPNKCIINM